MGGTCSNEEYAFNEGATRGVGAGGGPGVGGGGEKKRRMKKTPAMKTGFEEIKCSVDDLQDGQMKEVDVGDGSKKILLVHSKCHYYALSSKCTHYGAPLAKGALCNGRVQCPWHGACFNISTGDIEDYPGLDSLQTYSVTVDGKVATIRYKTTEQFDRRVRPIYQPTDADNSVVLIVGGGAAGAICVETLRHNGYRGRIVMATKEKHHPYDRPKISKALSSTAESLAFRNTEDFENYHVCFRPNIEATKVDVVKKSVYFSDKSCICYDKLLLCTGGRRTRQNKQLHDSSSELVYVAWRVVESIQIRGSQGRNYWAVHKVERTRPQTLSIPGSQLQNVFVLRTPDDGNKIATQAQGKRVVIIGQSFIGLEVAAYLVDKASSITVVGRAEIPLKNIFGEKIGGVIKKMLLDRGVKFVHGSSPKEFLSDNNNNSQLAHLLLDDGTRLEADVCVLGIGVRPVTDYLKDSGLQLSDDGFVLVNKNMETNLDNIYAAGDIVKFPLFLAEDKHANIQHWQMACKHGQVAALNILGNKTDLKSVPFFWTVILGKSLRYTGYGNDHDDVIIHGDLNEPKFVAFYTKGDVVVAVASMNYDPIVAQAAQLFHNEQTIQKSEILTNPQSWTDRLSTTSTL